ncbi:MAG: hypothetical protein JXQ71_14965, partial [Verrucomicrobia bacterium]|nr:hypothetical protein [Verrucomicrobiota bacterium]
MARFQVGETLREDRVDITPDRIKPDRSLDFNDPYDRRVLLEQKFKCVRCGRVGFCIFMSRALAWGVPTSRRHADAPQTKERQKYPGQKHGLPPLFARHRCAFKRPSLA